MPAAATSHSSVPVNGSLPLLADCAGVTDAFGAVAPDCPVVAPRTEPASEPAVPEPFEPEPEVPEPDVSSPAVPEEPVVPVPVAPVDSVVPAVPVPVAPVVSIVPVVPVAPVVPAPVVTVVPLPVFTVPVDADPPAARPLLPWAFSCALP